jgi:hypothetical protein
MWTRLVIGVVLVLVGVVWFGQGIGAIGGSFMTGEAFWAVMGAFAIAVGAVLLRGAARARRGDTHLEE